MTMEHNVRDADSVVFPAKQVLAIVADAELSVYQQTIRASADTDTGDITITLPNVGEASGKIYSILARDADNVNEVIIEDQNDSEYWGGDYHLNAPGEFIMLYSDGLKWCPICTNLQSIYALTTVIAASDAPPTTLAQ